LGGKEARQLIRITDRTLSCLDGYTLGAAPLSRFLELLLETDADAIELSEKCFQLLRPLPEAGNYILRVKKTADSARYPSFSRFVCRNAPADPHIETEIVLNDTRDAYTVARYADYENLRISGLDDIMLGDYAAVFRRVRDSFAGNITLCPTDRFGFASAIAAEWASASPNASLVTSFGGVGGFAPTEEMAIILRCQRLRRVTKQYGFFPEMAALFQTLTGSSFRGNKPILGESIFQVESGIHVDGILKQPKCYEPFPPETVGQSRKIIIGKQSGAASIRLKLSELGVQYGEASVAPLLARVKAMSNEKNRALTDAELAALAAVSDREG
jgi:homocitrate synthase NifV